MELTQEQEHIVKSVLRDVDNKIRIITVGGFAGTGKTTVAQKVYEELPNFAVCAFTGKAANVLRKKGVADAGTIHSLIYEAIRQPDGSVYFRLKDNVPCEGFLVDEGSMVSQDLFDDLCSFRKPIVLFGDHGQLEPVGSKANLMQRPMYRLETVHRYAGELAHFAEWVRLGKTPGSFKSNGSVTILKPYHLTTKHLLSADQVICAFNKTRVQTNAKIRAALGYEGTLVPEEKVMCLKNNSLLGIFNGMQGNVRHLYKDKNMMDFTSNELTYFALKYAKDVFGKEKPDLELLDLRQVNPFDYAYCVTAHKSQGDEWGHVLVIEQRCKHWEHKRWAYTAASRAKEKITWVAAPPPRENNAEDWF